MTKRERNEYEQRRTLQNAGVRVDKRDVIQPNHGSETFKHKLGKLAVAHVLEERGYRYDSEVEVPDGEIDMLGYANAEKDCIAVEIETSPTQEVITNKIERYVENLPIRECFVLNANEIPMDGMEAVEYVKEQL